MRRDEPHSTPEPGFTQRNYLEALQRLDIEAAEEGFYEERSELAQAHAPKYRLYINALPSAALEIFWYLRPSQTHVDGLISVKVGALGSYSGRRDMIVAYFADPESAIAAASALEELLTNIGDWPHRWVRDDVLPGTYRVTAGMGVAWDPQHLFDGSQYDVNRREICFGTTHAERYCALIEAFFLQVVRFDPGQIAESFARWVSEHADPLRPYNPPPKYDGVEPSIEK